MNLPKKTGVNFVENLDVVQQYEQLPNGNWVLTDDDMTVDLLVMKAIQGIQVKRTTKYSNYVFEPIEPLPTKRQCYQRSGHAHQK